MSSTTETTTAPTTFLSETIVSLFEREELFASAVMALAWAQKHGRTVLRPPALEAVSNLLTASREDRRTRGISVLERAICAQAAWLQLFELLAPAGKINLLKGLVEAIRSSEASSDEHAKAKADALDALDEFQKRRVAVGSMIDLITELAAEEAFVFAARDQLRDWQVTCLDAVLAGKGLRQHPTTLAKTADRLNFLSRKFFGEETSVTKPAAPRGRGRSAKKAAKSATDRELRASMRGDAPKKR